MRKIFFAGTFNPFTIGHDDLVRRALTLFDEVVIGIGINYNKEEDSKNASQKGNTLLTIRALYEKEPCVKVIEYNGITAQVAREQGCCALLRGIRTVKDYEYELQMADVNKALTGIETVILTAKPEYSFISSSMLRDLKSHGIDISKYLPYQA